MSDNIKAAEVKKPEFKQISAKVSIETWRAFRREAVEKDTKVALLAGSILTDAAAAFE